MTEEDVFKKLKESGFVTKTEVEEMMKQKPEMKQEPDTIPMKDIIEHMNSCTADDCGIHKNIDSKTSQAMKKGIVYGYTLANKK